MKLGLLPTMASLLCRASCAVAGEAALNLGGHLAAWGRETKGAILAWLEEDRARDEAALRGLVDERCPESSGLDQVVREVRRADRAGTFDEAAVRRLVAEDRRQNARGARGWN